MIKLLLATLLIFASSITFAQTNSGKIFFDKSGKTTTEAQAYYYRTQENGDSYKSYYISGGVYFEGRIINANKTNEASNNYTGKCTWYYKNGKTKVIKSFNAKGVEEGVSTYYYETGKVWKEIEYVNGAIKDNRYVEYDESGQTSRIFEEDFINNINDWDVYASNKSNASIANSNFELQSLSKSGTSRFISITNDAENVIIEAQIDISTIKDRTKTGIIYGFKDWQNYNFFVITPTSFSIGTVYEGLVAMKAEDMYTSDVSKTSVNNLKILNIGDKSVFSINGSVQFSNDSFRLFGSKVGFVVSGDAKIKVEKLIVKEVDFKGNSNNTSNADKNVKSTGSGFLVSKNGYIVTNHHVIDEAKSISIEFNRDGVLKAYNAVVVTSDKDNDIAVLKIDDKEFTNLIKIPFAFKESGNIEVGSTVYTIGYPMALSGMGKEAKFTDGKISSKTGYNNSLNSYQTTIPVQPGNSGGPVFDEKGRLIGLINAKINEADNVSYAIKLNYIKNIIETLPETIEVPNDFSIGNLPLQDQVKQISNYVVLIKIK